MSENNHTSSAPRTEGLSGDERPTSGHYVTLLLFGIVVALAVVLVAVVMRPPEELSPKEDVLAAAISQPPSSASFTPPMQVRGSTVRLPTVAIPATAEQLEEEAEGVAGVLRQMWPDLPEALHVVAMLKSQIRQSEEAEALWQRCIELDPKQVRYYVNLAAIAMDRGDSQLAADTSRRAIDAGIASADVYHHLAVALTKLGQSEEAEEVIQRALKLFPQSGAYWLVLGQAQLKAGKAAEAEASLRKAIELGTGTASAYFALGNACARQGKQEEAAKYRDLFTELKSTAPMDKQRRFQILSTAESRRTAVTILCEAAVVYQQQQNSLESERLLHRAIALDPSSPVACHLLVDLYEQAGMVAEARVVWNRLIEIEPFRLANYVMLAQSCAQLGKREEAEAALKLAVAISPEAVEGYATLAQFYLEGGKTGEARWFAQEAIRRQPSAAGYEFLASVCRMMGDESGAAAAEASAGQFAPVSQPPSAEAASQP